MSDEEVTQPKKTKTDCEEVEVGSSDPSPNENVNYEKTIIDCVEVEVGSTDPSPNETITKSYKNARFEAKICKKYDISAISVSSNNSYTESEIPNDWQNISVEYTTWPAWFCQQEAHRFYVNVDLEYIRKKNAKEFKSLHPNYKLLIAIIQDENNEEPSDFVNGEYQTQNQAYSLYGLIHAKYLLTNHGLEAMRENFSDGRYGVCLNSHCKFQRRIPCGKAKENGVQHELVLYCPCCEQLVYPKEIYQDIDGKHFGGIEFLSAFFEKFPEAINEKGPDPFHSSPVPTGNPPPEESSLKKNPSKTKK